MYLSIPPSERELPLRSRSCCLSAELEVCSRRPTTAHPARKDSSGPGTRFGNSAIVRVRNACCDSLFVRYNAPMAVTRRQKEILDFLESFVARNGYSPSFEEIARGMGLKSLATVHKHITNLEKKGMLDRVHNRSRSIDVAAPGHAHAVQRPASAGGAHRRRIAGGGLGNGGEHLPARRGREPRRVCP